MTATLYSSVIILVVFRSHVHSGVHKRQRAGTEDLGGQLLFSLGTTEWNPAPSFLTETCGVYRVSLRTQQGVAGERSQVRSSCWAAQGVRAGRDRRSPPPPWTAPRRAPGTGGTISGPGENSSMRRDRVSPTASGACGGAKVSKLPPLGQLAPWLEPI